MRGIGIGIEADGEAKLAHAFFQLVIQQESFAEDAVFGGIRGILANRQLQLVDRTAVIFLRHVSVSEATVPLLPLGVLAVKIAQFENRRVEVALVAVGVAQVVANRRFLGRKTLGFPIFGDRFLELVFFVQNQRQIGMSLPEGRVQMKSLAIGGDGGGHVSLGVQGDAQVVVGIHVTGIAGERFDESMNRRAILSIGVQSETEELVRLGVLRIHAERGARFRNRVGTVIETIKDVGQTAVVLREIGH